MLGVTDLSTWTPVQIDTEIARIYDLQWENSMQRSRVIDTLEHMLHDAQGKSWREKREPFSPELLDRVCSTPGIPEYTRTRLHDQEQALLRLKAVAQDLRDELKPYHAQYVVRRWTRAFLVITSGMGHVHSSMECSTCNKMGKATRFHWFPEDSGKTEAEIIEKAKSQACTVCYPNAPVTKEPGAYLSKDQEAAAKAREEREAKRQEREAAKITLNVWTQRYSETEPRLKEVTWKTTRALQNDAGSLVVEITGAYALVHGFDLEMYKWVGQERVRCNQDEAFHNLRLMLEALKERGVDTDALVARAHKRAVKDGGTLWDGVL